MFRVAAMSLMFVALGSAHQDHPPMSPREHAAFHSVAQMCRNDVDRLCFPQMDGFHPQQHVMMMEPLMAMNDLSSMIDSMFDTALGLTSVSSTPTFFHIEFVSPPMEASGPESMLDAMVKHMADSSPPDDFADFSKHVVEHAKAMMEDTAIPEERRHLARRLTEVAPEHCRKHKVMLPFEGSSNACLRSAFEQNAVSESCGRAIMELDTARRVDAIMEDRAYSFFFGMTCLYGILVCLLLLVIMRRFRSSWKNSNPRLRLRIMQAIYSNPELKARLEKELGEPLGAVPPLAPWALRRLSPQGREAIRARSMYGLFKLVFLVGLMVMIFVAPFWVLPICIVTLLVRLVQVGCCHAAPTSICVCCCCGGSTEDVKNGTMSEAQGCCKCCKGTGICALACAGCCGNKGSCGCNCGSKDCCCGGGGGAVSTSSSGRNVGSGCNCGSDCTCPNGDCGCGPDCDCGNGCSCGSTCECVNCTCGPGRDCSKKVKGRGQKHTFYAEEGVYHGVPVQVV